MKTFSEIFENKHYIDELDEKYNSMKPSVIQNSDGTIEVAFSSESQEYANIETAINTIAAEGNLLDDEVNLDSVNEDEDLLWHWETQTALELLFNLN